MTNGQKEVKRRTKRGQQNKRKTKKEKNRTTLEQN